MKEKNENKLKPEGKTNPFGDKFFDLSLEFRKDLGTNPNLKTSKRFIFAKKELMVELLSDIRNLIFLCKTCNTSKPKNGGWTKAMESDPFKTVVGNNLNQEMAKDLEKKPYERPIINFVCTEKFQA